MSPDSGVSLVVLLSALGGLLMLGLALKPLATYFRFPFEALLLLLAFAFGGLFFEAEEVSLHSETLRDLVFYVFLPVIIFSTAYSMDAPRFGRNLLAIILLALPLALISLAFTTVLVYVGIGHHSGFPWMAALLTGAILSTTNSQAMQQIFERLNLSADLKTLISGEDLLNNAFGIVLFTLLLAYAMHDEVPLGATDLTVYVLWETLGGIATGFAVGFFALVFLRMLRLPPREVALFTLVAAYLAYLVADTLLQVSGVLSVLITALIMGRTMHQDLNAAQDHFVDEFWRFNATFVRSILYLMLGMSITLSMFTERWLAILIGIGAVLLARFAGVFLVMPILMRASTTVKKIPDHDFLYFSSTRGAVTVGLALSVPPNLSYWWTIESIGFGVVLFSFLVQAPLLGFWRRKQVAQVEEEDEEEYH